MTTVRRVLPLSMLGAWASAFRSTGAADDAGAFYPQAQWGSTAFFVGLDVDLLGPRDGMNTGKRAGEGLNR